MECASKQIQSNKVRLWQAAPPWRQIIFSSFRDDLNSFNTSAFDMCKFAPWLFHLPNHRKKIYMFVCTYIQITTQRLINKRAMSITNDVEQNKSYLKIVRTRRIQSQSITIWTTFSLVTWTSKNESSRAEADWKSETRIDTIQHCG